MSSGLIRKVSGRWDRIRERSGREGKEKQCEKQYFTMCSFFLGEVGRGNCGTGRKEIETLRSVKIRREGKMLEHVKNVKNNIFKLDRKTQAVKGSKKQVETDFTVLTHNICCSV